VSFTLILLATTCVYSTIDFSLKKKVEERATYQMLMEHPFLEHHAKVNKDISEFVAEVLYQSSSEDETW